MNKEMQKLLKAINDKKNEVKSLVNDGKLDKARGRQKRNSKSYRKSLTSCSIWTRRNMRRSRTRWRREQQRPSGQKQTRKTS